MKFTAYCLLLIRQCAAPWGMLSIRTVACLLLYKTSCVEEEHNGKISKVKKMFRQMMFIAKRINIRLAYFIIP